MVRASHSKFEPANNYPAELEFEIRTPQIIRQHSSDRASDRVSDRAIDRASDRAIERSSDRAIERSSDRAIERSSDRATERPSDRATEDDHNSSSRHPFETLTSAFDSIFQNQAVWNTPEARIQANKGVLQRQEN